MHEKIASSLLNMNYHTSKPFFPDKSDTNPHRNITSFIKKIFLQAKKNFNANQVLFMPHHEKT